MEIYIYFALFVKKKSCNQIFQLVHKFRSQKTDIIFWKPLSKKKKKKISSIRF